MDQQPCIANLNQRFGLGGPGPAPVQVVAGKSGLPLVRVATHLAAAEIYLHGAQVTAWKPAGHAEVLFLSEKSHWQAGKAIRGGIPICFPWFRAKADDPKAPAHGVVRTREWRLDAVSVDEAGEVTIILSTESDEATRRLWPRDFHLMHRITVGKALRLELIAKNTGAEAFRFEEALHTYFRVGSAEAVRVRGLDGASFLDNTDNNAEKVQQGDVAFLKSTDNAYLHTAGALELVDPVLHRTLRTDKENSATTVVWNPWQQGAAALADLGDAEWQHFACVEAANIMASAIPLAPGEEHTLRATIGILPV